MAVRVNCGILCICLAQDGISLIFTEVQIELGQIRPPRMGQSKCCPATCYLPEWQQQVVETEVGVGWNSVCQLD